MEALFSWHERPGALERLSPPWDPVELVERTGGIEDGSEAVLKVRIGPKAVLWHARHRDYAKDQLFRDEQVRGPFKYWCHSHRFEALGNDRSVLEDRIEYALPGPAIGTLMMGAWVEKNLDRVFRYRHQTLANDLETVARYPSRPLRIVISGAGGVLGSALVPFLTTAGHRVIRLVRRPPRDSQTEARWDPQTGRLDPAVLAGADAVIHLSGENIGKGRWTAEKKRRIIDSRVLTTTLLADTINRMPSPPAVFLSASAIGYYGNRGAGTLLEDDCSGRDFVSEVCKLWEEATGPALGDKLRVVHLRIGVVLTPQGGALAQMLPVYRLGLGGPIGSGDQFVSWIHIDDVLGAIYHAIFTPKLEGPINLTAPNIARQQDFCTNLAVVLGRPAKCRLHPGLIRFLFGQKGEEILLSSTRAFPHKLLQTGYRFRYSELQPALRHILGLQPPIR